MPVITVMPGGQQLPCRDGETLFAAVRQAGVPVSTACVGKGNCGLCRVRILAGEAALSPFSAVEERHLGNVYFITRERLACQTHATGDVTLELAPRRGRRT